MPSQTAGKIASITHNFIIKRLKRTNKMSKRSYSIIYMKSKSKLRPIYSTQCFFHDVKYHYYPGGGVLGEHGR